MNRKLVVRMLGIILLVEAAAMLPSLIISLCNGGQDAPALLISMVITAAVGLPMRFLSKPAHTNLRAREGFLIVTLSWIVMSLFGALPFVFSGFIPNYIDAVFETASGFTTTGASILTDVEALSRSGLFWRSFTHWIGGMGVLVLTLALIPQLTGRSAYLVRAESPGPSLSKLAPKMTDSAKILYLIYTILTVLMFICLLLCGVTPYDAAIHAFGTAGTGGFSNYADSIAAFHSPAVEIVVTVFMTIFGTNLALYYSIFNGRWKDFLKSEELRWYLCINAGAALFFTFNILSMPEYQGDFAKALRHACFNTATVTSTSGFGVTSFTLWPAASQTLIMVLMFFGSCVGSTAGGMKTMRIALMIKQGLREITRTFSPRKVSVVRFEGRGIDEHMLHQVAVFAFVYFAMVLGGSFLVSLEGKYDLLTHFTAALTCTSNVGPAFGGAASNFAGYGSFAKIIFSILMLAGRLELFPILAIFHPDVWRKA